MAIFSTIASALLAFTTAVRGQSTGTSQVPQQATPQFHFYSTANGIPAYGTVDVTKTNSITFTWQYDTCAGATDGGGNAVAGAKSNPSGGGCVDGNGNKLGAATDPIAVFPQGFQYLYLQQGFNPVNTTTRVDLLGQNVNGAQFAAATKSVTIGIGGFVADYYTLVLGAVDANGAMVVGSSAPIAFIGNGNLPQSNTLTLHSPLQSAYWIPSSPYRIRYEIQPSGFIPPAYTIDLLTPNGEVVMRIGQAVFPLVGDTLYGASRMLNYSVWSVPVELANRAFKIRVQGVGFDGNVVSSIAGGPVGESGVFYIGNVISK